MTVAWVETGAEEMERRGWIQDSKEEGADCCEARGKRQGAVLQDLGDAQLGRLCCHFLKGKWWKDSTFRV